MFDYIKDEELRELLRKINNNDDSVNNVKSSLDFARGLNCVNKDEHEQLVSEFIKNKSVLLYISKWLNNTNLSVMESNHNIYIFIKLLMTKVGDIDIKLDLFEICFKLRCDLSIHLAIDEYSDELKDLLFDRIFKTIKKDTSKEYLKIFISILMRKSDDIKDVIIFDFIDLLYNIKLDNKEYKQIDDLIGRIGIKDKDIKNELIKLKLSKLRESKEYEVVNEIIEDDNPTLKDVDIDILVMSINSKSTEEIINVLEYLKNSEILESVINTIIFSEKVDIDRDKLIKIIKIKSIYTHKEQEYFVNTYIKENNISIELFEKEHCSDDYISKINNKVKTHIENNNTKSIISILQEEQDNEILKALSKNAIEQLLELKKVNTLIELWDEFKLSVILRLEYGEKIKDLIIETGEASHNALQFLVDIDQDNINVYKSINDKKSRNRILSIWAKNNKSGKIVDALKYKIDKEVKNINDLKDIKELIDLYNINDDRLSTYIKLKVYSSIELELLEIDYMNSEDSIKLDEIIDLVVEYNLENRLLNDKYILDMLDKEIKDYLSKRIITKSQSIDVLDAFWNLIDEAIRNGRKVAFKKDLKILVPYIVGDDDKIDWFIKLLEEKKYNHDVIENIIETCLETMGRDKAIINQLNKEIEKIEPKVISKIGKNLVNSLVKLEKSVINISDEKQRNILVNNIKGLRYALSEVGIETAEEIQNYNKTVELDDNKHSLIGKYTNNLYTVETLGIKINGEIIAKSMISDKVGEEEVIG